ncbi:MAG: chitobiase/beta-hexosaminidase C-terminal domain-containing protein [Bacteroidales bacterium]|nr:chitobiase/beta-hexosaminidase C-terminal domain-containing protein [Candidatus Liminaster caballi]
MKKIIFILLLVICTTAWSQTLNILPTITPEGGTFDDEVTISCTFPEGCAGGRYWFNGGELKATDYTRPFTIDYSADISVAGVNEDGRIITDIVTRHFDVVRATPPYVTPTPAEGVRKESFYVTKLEWNNVTSSELALNDFKEGGSRHGQPVVWVTNQRGMIVAQNDYNGLWANGLNQYKAYIYKDYKIVTPGQYILHIAKDVFILDGTLYDQEIQLRYAVSYDLTAPEFTPASGEYSGQVDVSIEYPTDGSAFYMLYRVNGQRAKAYTGPFTISQTSTVEAWGMDEEYTYSTDTASVSYTILQPEAPADTIAAPVIHRDGNIISISGPEGATIKVWYNDRMNTAMLYATPFEVTRNCKLSCVAYSNEGISRTVNLVVSGFPGDGNDLGDMTLITPAGFETVYVNSLSANGRYAVGHTGSDYSSKGFIWDLSSDKFQYQSTLFVNQLLYVADDGTAYGWRMRTADAGSDTDEEDLLWGTCKDGVWTEQPRGLSVKGITADSRLYGSYEGRPVIFDMQTGIATELSATSGTVTAISADMTIVGGTATIDGQTHAIIWQRSADDTYSPIFTLPTDMSDLSVTHISGNGEWALIGETMRVHITTGEHTDIISMSSRFHNEKNPECLRCIADDGTIFGTYDESLLSPDKGLGLVYTTDCRWRSIYDWMLDEKGLDIASQLSVTSVRAVTGNHGLLLFHGVSLAPGEDQTFTRGIALMAGVAIRHLAPTAVHAQQMQGLEIIKVSWESPLTMSDDVKQYIVRRNGVVTATIDASADTYWYDYDILSGQTYTYTVSAVYHDGVESDQSYGSTVFYMLERYLPARNLTLRQAGLSDVYATWDAPVVSLPKLQYFDERNEWFAFGSAHYNAEWGIRIQASDLASYSDMQIRTFQFLPTGQQKSYELRLYTGGTAADDGYNPVPFYTQAIDASTLDYGVVNVITLDQPQDIDPTQDLYVALYIETIGTDDMLGVSYEGARSGYTDLCRIEGVFDSMVSIAQNSSSVTELVLPLGIGICSADNLSQYLVSSYEVTDNGTLAATVSSPRFRFRQLAEGRHQIDVTAVYGDGAKSLPASVVLDLAHNTEALVPIDDFEITANEDHSATLRWQAPIDDDRTLIHWGDLTPMPGLPVYQGFTGYMAASVYPATLTLPYNGAYEITHVFFCPLDGSATYEVSLADGAGTILFSVEPDGITAGEINYIALDEPITLNSSLNYMLMVSAYDLSISNAPLAYDSSGHWSNGFSNLFDYGMGLGYLSELVSNGEYPNWLMGLSIRQKDSAPLPLQGYTVRIDGLSQTAMPLTGCTFTTAPLAEGLHTAAVDVVYDDDNHVSGLGQEFVIGNASAITATEALSDEAEAYDLAGRRVITDRQGRALYIIHNKKTIR